MSEGPFVVPDLIRYGKLIRPGLGVSLVANAIVTRWGIVEVEFLCTGRRMEAAILLQAVGQRPPTWGLRLEWGRHADWGRGLKEEVPWERRAC